MALTFCVVVEAVTSCSDFDIFVVVVLLVVADLYFLVVVCLDLGVVGEGILTVEVLNLGFTRVQDLKKESEILTMLTNK